MKYYNYELYELEVLSVDQANMLIKRFSKMREYADFIKMNVRHVYHRFIRYTKLNDGMTKRECTISIYAFLMSVGVTNDQIDVAIKEHNNS